MGNERRLIDISTLSILRLFLLLLFFVFLFFVRDVLVVLFLAIIIAASTRLSANWLKKFKIPYFLGIILIYFAILLFISVIVYAIIPLLIEEVKQLAVSLPLYYKNINDVLGFSDSPYVQSFGSGIGKTFENIEKTLAVTAGGVFAFLTNVLGGITSLIFVFVLSFYLSLKENAVESFLKVIVPKGYENYILNLWDRIQKKFGRWIQGQITLGIMIFLLTFFALSMLDVKYPLILAILSGILEIIPVAGLFISAIMASVIAFLQQPILALWTAASYVVINSIENNVLIPFIMKNRVGVDPVIIILAVLIGAKLYGILGVLIAVPIAAVLTELYSDLKEKKLLNKPLT